MRNLHRALLAGMLGFAVSFVASCGGGAGLLSGDQANTLNNQLSRISSDLAGGRCGAVRAASQRLVVQVSNLPSTIDSTLRQYLGLGASTIDQLAAQQCHPQTTRTTTQTTTSTPTTTATTTTTTTTTTPPTTTATTTTSVIPPVTTITTGPSGGGGLGGGGGTGSGGGGDPSGSGLAPGASAGGGANG